MGIDRSLYTILEHSLREDKENDRTVLSLKPYLSPIHVGVLSLVKKDGLAEKTDEIYLKIKRKYDVFLDHSGAIGRRYRSWMKLVRLMPLQLTTKRYKMILSLLECATRWNKIE